MPAEYGIRNFDRNEDTESDRKGYSIFLREDPAAGVTCYEGNDLEIYYGPEMIEPDILEIATLNVPENLGRKRIGTKLLELALLEAKARSFSTARAQITSPRTVRIFQYLEEVGIVEAHRLDSWHNGDGQTLLTPTNEYIYQDGTLDYAGAVAYLRELAVCERLEPGDRKWCLPALLTGRS